MYVSMSTRRECVTACVLSIKLTKSIKSVFLKAFFLLTAIYHNRTLNFYVTTNIDNPLLRGLRLQAIPAVETIATENS